MEKMHFIEDQQSHDLGESDIPHALPGHHVPFLWGRHQHLQETRGEKVTQDTDM